MQRNILVPGRFLFGECRKSWEEVRPRSELNPRAFLFSPKVKQTLWRRGGGDRIGRREKWPKTSMGEGEKEMSEDGELDKPGCENNVVEYLNREEGN